jgi:hypothetical protein
MNRLCPPIPKRRPAHFVLALFALVMKVLVPSGFMLSPTQAQAGLTPIVLCTAAGNLTALMDSDGTIVSTSEHGAAPVDHDETPHAPCTFAGHHGAAQAPVMMFVVVPQVRPMDLTQRGQEAVPVPGLGLAAPPPPKTGPPIQV